MKATTDVHTILLRNSSFQVRSNEIRRVHRTKKGVFSTDLRVIDSITCPKLFYFIFVLLFHSLFYWEIIPVLLFNKSITKDLCVIVYLINQTCGEVGVYHS